MWEILCHFVEESWVSPAEKPGPPAAIRGNSLILQRLRSFEKGTKYPQTGMERAIPVIAEYACPCHTC